MINLIELCNKTVIYSFEKNDVYPFKISGRVTLGGKNNILASMYANIYNESDVMVATFSYRGDKFNYQVVDCTDKLILEISSLIKTTIQELKETKYE